ncbi:nephrin-like isoform X1 [Onthophagus taurus]|uniref:nephrin-like isoform X1 n=1 Tax=Onthophagus taurus TaxID=166361 RepID=UPI0039BDA6D7
MWLFNMSFVLVPNFKVDTTVKLYTFLWRLLLVWIVCVNLFVVGGIAKVEDDTVVVHDVKAVQGGKVKLPCDVAPSSPDDRMHIVIWFKELPNGKQSPIYSFDSREKNLENGRHWWDESILGERSTFRYQDKPAKLILNSAKDSDAGIYLCRVDFKQTPTRNVKVNLTIIIPPEKLSILDERGYHIPNYILGPYNEGSSINITCVATGGRPPPEVTWWLENTRLDTTFEHLSERRVRNILHLEKLERKHLHNVFTCQAANNQLMTPISSSVSLDLNLRPLWVKLIGVNKPLSADSTYELSCEVVGAKPKPTITWWKGSVQMKNTREIISPDNNTTTSVLTYTPTVDDGGKYLSCRGQVESIPDSGKEDGWKLDIHHVPLVSLELGSNLNGSIIKEGVDVYFECNIKSNPWVYKVSWRHNGKTLYNNAATGTIVSNQSLVLQSVTRARAGLYTCVGSNREGDGESNAVQLDVKFAPVCRPGQAKSFGVARHERAKIPCELEANPVSGLVFTWKFNNSAETIDIQQSHVFNDGATSNAIYTPMTEPDYGTLMCWGRNEIGIQKEPCVYYINPAGKPDPLSNCTILNETAESLHVECSEGFDGGLHQEFIMEVYDASTKKLVSNVTSRIPIFTVGGLESGLSFEIGLYATNKKGHSDVVRLQAFTLKSAEKHTVLSSNIVDPKPPENCTLKYHTKKFLQVRCQVSKDQKQPGSTYLLQVYDANTRLLLATATSQVADSITVSSLPKDHDSLLLFVRTVTPKSTTSNAAILYAPPATSNSFVSGASTPVFLQITPILGALIGVVVALILVAIIIVVVIRLRNGDDHEDKDYDDGGLSPSGRRCVAGSGDKASTEPLNKDLNDSVDSLEEKNPDIIPQNNCEDEYMEDERGFERLNNSTLYRRVNPNNVNKNFDYPKTNDEITYAELSLPNQQMPHVIYNQQPMPMAMIPRQEPTVYAQIDVNKRIQTCLQTLSPPHPSTFQPMHHPHPHHPYMPRLREERILHENVVNTETPLVNPRDSSALQPLLEVSSSKPPTITSSQPRSVTATRF